MADVWAMGELLVEVMRPKAGMSLAEPGPFLGPYPSGAPGIFVDTVGRLGHSAAIISGVGDDDFGDCILNRLKQDGVEIDQVLVVPDNTTGVAFVTYFEDGSRKYLFHWDGTPAVMAETPPATAIRGAKYFHVMGCSLMANPQFRTAVLATVDLFVSEGAKITFDPNIRFELLHGQSPEEIVRPILEHCSVLFPGETELRLIAGTDHLDRAAEAMFRTYPLEIVVVKQGGRGCTVYTPKEQLAVPAFEIEEVDPTGAGDCFDGAFLCGLLERKPIDECARLAAAAGELNTQAFGPMEGEICSENVAKLLEPVAGLEDPHP